LLLVRGAREETEAFGERFCCKLIHQERRAFICFSQKTMDDKKAPGVGGLRHICRLQIFTPQEGSPSLHKFLLKTAEN
jgi:hypothetical protein